MEKYIPLRIETINPQVPITFTLYIYFKEQYVFYLGPKNCIDPEKLDKLKKQQVARFFIQNEEQSLYLSYLEKLLINSSMNETDTTSKIDFVGAAAMTSVESMGQENPTQASYKITQNAVKSIRDVIGSNPDALKKLFGKAAAASESDKIIKHCLNVSALSSKVANGVGLSSDEIDELCTAALIHDIGVLAMPPEDRALFDKPRRLFTMDDTRFYNAHVKKVEEMLNDRPYITKSVKDLVMAHEEVRSGTGPLRKKKLTMSEEILSLCDCYDKRLSALGKSPKETIKTLEVEELGNYDLNLIKHFKKVLNDEGLMS